MTNIELNNFFHLQVLKQSYTCIVNVNCLSGIFDFDFRLWSCLYFDILLIRLYIVPTLLLSYFDSC